MDYRVPRTGVRAGDPVLELNVPRRRESPIKTDGFSQCGHRLHILVSDADAAGAAAGILVLLVPSRPVLRLHYRSSPLLA
jgi:hypothetical protein